MRIDRDHRGASLASSVFAPVAFALFIIALVWPLQKRLQAVLPRLLALAISIVVMVVAFVAFGSLIAWAFGRVGRWIVSDAARFQPLYDQSDRLARRARHRRRRASGPSISTSAGCCARPRPSPAGSTAR